MKTKICLILLLTGILSPARGQIKSLLKKVKEETVDQISNITTEDVLNKGKELTVAYLTKARDEYDQTDFNYAVSFSDNSGFYESEEKYHRLQKGLLYILSPESLEQRTDKQRAADYNDVGEVLYASGKFRSAELSFLAARTIYKLSELEPCKGAALTTSNLGLLYHTTGRLSKAEEFTLEALKMRRDQLGDIDGYGASLNNMGVLYKDLGKYAEAEEYLNRALEVTRETKGSQGSACAIVLNNLAILYQVTGKYDDAEKLLLQALSIASDDMKEKSPNYVRLKVNLALLYQLQQRYEEAEEICLDAIRTKQNRLGTNHPDYAVLLQNLASLYQLTGRYDLVEKNLDKAIHIYKRKFGEQHHVYAGALYDMARYRLFRGETKQARSLLEQAREVQLEKLGVHHPAYVNTLETIAILEWQEENWNASTENYRRVMDEYLYQIHTYFPAMSEYDKSRFWSTIQPKFIRFHSYAMEARQEIPGITYDMYRYHIATKALLLSSTSKVKKRILESGDEALVGKYREWLDLKEYLSKLYTLSKEELEADRINLDSLEQVANTREKELSQVSELFAGAYTQKEVTPSDIALRLSSGEACVEFIRINRYRYLEPDTTVVYAALVLDRNNYRQPDLVVFPNGKELETTEALRYRRLMQTAREGEPFYHIYWRDLEDITRKVGTLYVSLDGVYNQINLKTLQKEDGSYLIDEKNLIYLTNTSDLPALKDRLEAGTFQRKQAFLAGNPFYAKNFDWNRMVTMPLPELPGTQEEVDRINELLKSRRWNTRIITGEEATEEAVKQISSPALLHIATHGFFLEDLPDGLQEKVFGIEPMKAAENPLLRSGLLFTGADNTLQHIETTGSNRRDDGVLNAFEAMILDLDQTGLVVLSACETGLGEIVNGEGVYGLQRALQIAGASTVVISLWQVSDEVTQELMTRFYRYWLDSGDKLRAFEKAQLEIKQKYPSPFYWGAFVMVNS